MQVIEEGNRAAGEGRAGLQNPCHVGGDTEVRFHRDRVGYTNDLHSIESWLLARRHRG